MGCVTKQYNLVQAKGQWRCTAWKPAVSVIDHLEADRRELGISYNVSSRMT